MQDSIYMWGGLIAFVLIAFLIDFKLFEPKDGSRASFKRAGVWSVIWLLVAFAFAGIIYATDTTKQGTDFVTGYLLERSLSLDNVFVFALIFGAMSVPEEYRQRMLEFGIMLALILRFAFIAIGAELISRVTFVLVIFGVFLIYTGIQMARHRDEDEDFDADKNIGVKIARRLFPVTDGYEGGKVFVKKDGKLMATLLFPVVMAIAFADVIFAVDSIPAIFAITTDTFIVFSANAFALLGMRALFALLENARERFVYLKLGLAFILVFIGVKMVLAWDPIGIHIPTAVSLGVIIVTLLLSIVLSLKKTAPADSTPPGSGPPAAAA